MGWDPAVLVAAAVAGTGLLSLIWTIVSFFLRRDFQDIRNLAVGLRATPENDPLHHAYLAAIYERLYRSHYPARRDGLTLATIWTFSLVVSLPFAASDFMRHLHEWLPVDKLWIGVLGYMLLIGAAVWMLNSLGYRLKENVTGRADDLHARYRALCFQERAKFLEDTQAVEDPKRPDLKGWLDIVVGGRKRKKDSEQHREVDVNPERLQ